MACVVQAHGKHSGIISKRDGNFCKISKEGRTHSSRFLLIFTPCAFNAAQGSHLCSHELQDWAPTEVDPSHTRWLGFPCSSVRKASACNADLGSTPGSGRSPGERNGNPLQYSCLENPMDRGAWQVTVHGVAWVGHNWATKHRDTSTTAARSPLSISPGRYRCSPKGTCKNAHSSSFVISPNWKPPKE